MIVQNNSNNEDTLILEDDPGHWNTAHMFNSKANNRSPTAIKSKKTMVEALSKADLKLLLVPFIFFLFRFWGTLRFFISMMPSCNIYVPETERKPDMAFFCIHTSCYRVLYNEVLLLLNVSSCTKCQLLQKVLYQLDHMIIYLTLYLSYVSTHSAIVVYTVFPK